MSRNDGPIQRSDAEYALIVIHGLRRMVERTEMYQAFVLPRDITKGNADRSEVLQALAFTDAILTSLIHSDRVDKALHGKEIWHDRSGD